MSSNSLEIRDKTFKSADFSITFDHEIDSVIHFEKKHFILLRIPSASNATDNIYAVGSNGQILWQIENPIVAFSISPEDPGYRYTSQSVYVSMVLENQKMIATTFFADKYVVDINTGKLISKKNGRW